MSAKDLGSIPQIAQELVEHLPKAMDDELKALLARAGEGQDTTVAIVSLFARYTYTQQWLQENIKLLGREKSGAHGEHGPLAGNIVWIPPSQKWVCRENPNKHWLMVLQEDEDAPMCPICQKNNREEEMVRERNKKG